MTRSSQASQFRRVPRACRDSCLAEGRVSSRIAHRSSDASGMPRRRGGPLLSFHVSQPSLTETKSIDDGRVTRRAVRSPTFQMNGMNAWSPPSTVHTATQAAKPSLALTRSEPGPSLILNPTA